MQPIHHCHNRGSATILMTFMVAVILTVGLGFNWLVKEHLKAAESLKKKAEAIVMARSAYDTVIYLLLSGKVMSREVTLSGAEKMTSLKALPLNGSPIPFSEDVFVRIQDSNGRLSLTTLNSEAMKRLVRRLLPLENAAIPVNSLQDWTDPDDLTRLNGAERSFYRQTGYPCLPRNYALQFGEEFGMVRGMSPAGYERLRSSLTLLPSTGFNPNTASDEVIMAYLDLNEETVERIKAYRAENGVISADALYVLTGGKVARRRATTAYSPSLYLDVSISVGQPKSMYSLYAGLHLRQSTFAPYGILSWREE